MGFLIDDTPKKITRIRFLENSLTYTRRKPAKPSKQDHSRKREENRQLLVNSNEKHENFKVKGNTDKYCTEVK